MDGPSCPRPGPAHSGLSSAQRPRCWGTGHLLCGRACVLVNLFPVKDGIPPADQALARTPLLSWPRLVTCGQCSLGRGRESVFQANKVYFHSS